MLTDFRQHIRDLVFRRMISTRSKPNKSVKSFEVHLLNFEASEYTNLISWKECKLTETFCHVQLIV